MVGNKERGEEEGSQTHSPAQAIDHCPELNSPSPTSSLFFFQFEVKSHRVVSSSPKVTNFPKASSFFFSIIPPGGRRTLVLDPDLPLRLALLRGQVMDGHGDPVLYKK